jgi:uncharacterized small protein (DUF1192 family)
MSERKRRRGDLTSQPHNALITFAFSRREDAAGLLRAALPGEVSALVRWGTLKLESVQFVERTLRGRSADLWYSAEMSGERVHFEVVVEHQSTVDRAMVFRMSATMSRRWDRILRDAPDRWPLPLIIPLLIHHSGTGWTAATSFQEIISIPAGAREAVARYVPHFEMKVVDVSHDPASGLVHQALTDLGRIVLWCLSVAWDDERLQQEIDRLVAELHALYTTPEAIDALVAVLRYLTATHPRLGVTKVENLLKTTAQKGTKEADVDRLDEYIHERARAKVEEGTRKGIAEGRAQGIAEGQARVLLGQLASRFGRVPAEAKARVLAASEATLMRWSLLVLTAPTLGSVLDGEVGATKAGATKKAVAAERTKKTAAAPRAKAAARRGTAPVPARPAKK